ncbi:hypothetical protein SORBI_3004G160950 [Sorghum bicolor]|uniref:Uncharacterized protein n=1 Tax=Sorghum bicolor TaxID=4558 RepID=A0A1Z5RMX0_SORBI|nr:hypothetical protein SORBI_3004G160950 [Sorghum bicolor]
MAVHAQYHAFPHDLDHRAITSSPALDNDATTASAFLVADPATAAGGRNTVLSDLTCDGDNNDTGCLRKRKRARVTMDLQGQRALLPPTPVPVPGPQALALAPTGDVQSRALCGSAFASTSGAAPVSQGLLSHLYRHSVEIDLLLLLRIEVHRPVLPFYRGNGCRSMLLVPRSHKPFSWLLHARRLSGCGRGSRTRGAGTPAPCCRRWNAPRRGA